MRNQHQRPGHRARGPLRDHGGGGRRRGRSASRATTPAASSVGRARAPASAPDDRTHRDRTRTRDATVAAGGDRAAATPQSAASRHARRAGRRPWQPRRGRRRPRQPRGARRRPWQPRRGRRRPRPRDGRAAGDDRGGPTTTRGNSGPARGGNQRVGTAAGGPIRRRPRPPRRWRTPRRRRLRPRLARPRGGDTRAAARPRDPSAARRAAHPHRHERGRAAARRARARP